MEMLVIGTSRALVSCAAISVTSVADQCLSSRSNGPLFQITAVVSFGLGPMTSLPRAVPRLFPRGPVKLCPSQDSPQMLRAGAAWA